MCMFCDVQVYHHVCVLFCVWLAMVSRANTTWVFVIFNSFVHTFMYAYYAYTALGFKLHHRYKSIVTKMQLTQFYLGQIINGFAVVVFWHCSTVFENVLGVYTFTFVVSLILLFTRFYKKTYRHGKDNKKKVG